MKYGHFDDQNREYVIKRPDTPLPWINYLGSNEFFGIISNTAGGYSFYRDARLRRITRYRYNDIPMDNNGRYLYIKDGDTVWNPTWKPMRTELDEYECRHGMGYTKIKGIKDGLEVSITFFIPPNSTNEIWDVTVKNHSDEEKSIRMWSFVEWCLWDAYDDMTNFQRNFNTGEVEVKDSTIFHKTEYRERRNHYTYFSANCDISGYDTARKSFVGVHKGLETPNVIEQGEAQNSIAHGWSPIGSHQIDLELAPGEEEEISFLLGYAENDKDNKWEEPGVINKENFYEVYEKYNKKENVDKAFQELNEYWDDLLGKYQVDSNDTIVDRMVNIWNQYQCMVTFNMSRSASFYESGIGRGMGFRDSNQDLLGFVHMIPERARQRVLDIASTQLSDGTCYHQYQPLTKEGNSEIGGGFYDDHLWLILSTVAYIKETGDYSILEEEIGYADKEDSDATLLDHLEQSIQFTLDNLGPHDLPLIGHADWNDCMNLNCYSDDPDENFQLAGHSKEGDVAESLLIAGMFCRASQEMADLYESMDRAEEKKIMEDKKEDMKESIYEHGWDGDWFLRAYDAKGDKVGSSENEEGKIFIESQGWCIYGGVGFDNDYAEEALESVNENLATEDGIKLLDPPYSQYYINLGEISSYPPGYKENASIFTHNNTWIQISETMLGHGDRAMEYYKSICPPSKEEQIERYKAEPYVYSQMTAGPDAATPGEGKNSWLTGTAAWSYVTIAQHILGIQPDYKGLKIDPCIPKDWDEYTVNRKFRGAEYNITVKNPDSVNKGIKKIEVDGESIEDNIITDMEEGKTYDVTVIMGN